MTTRLLSVEMSGFRAFNSRQSFPIGAAATVISGPNGLGKTSIVDAIAWGLTGRLRHLERVRQRKNEEVVRNVYSASQAEVALTCLLNDSVVVVTRVGDSHRPVLGVTRDGAELGPTQAQAVVDDLCEALGADEGGAMLRQDEIRSVILAPPETLHRRLRDLLGLADLDRFESAVELADTRAQEIARNAKSEMQTRRAELGARRLALEELQRAVGITANVNQAWVAFVPIWEATSDRLSVSVPRPPDAAGIRLLLSTLRGQYSRLTALGSRLDVLVARRAALAPVSGDANASDLDAAISAAESRERDLRQAVAEQSSRSEVEGAFDALVSAAAPLLTETCPVCGQTIDPSDLRQRLLQKVGPSASAVRYDELRSELRALEREIASLSRDRRDRDARRVAQVAWNAEYGSLLDELARDDGLGMPSLARAAAAQAPVEELAQTINATLVAVSELGTAVRHLSEALEPVDRLGSLSTLEQSVRDAEQGLEIAEQQAERSAARAHQTAALFRAAKSAATTVTSEAFLALEPMLNHIYQRISPHPTFTSTSIVHDFYQSRGRSLPRLIDPVMEVDVNPLTTTSLGHLNVIALSYFLAMSLAQAHPELVVMDDPVQAMDDVNVLGLSDLCRHVRNHKQLLVTTHDSRFAGLLARKLWPSERDGSVVTIEFKSWSRTGPEVVVAELPPTTDRRVINQVA